MAEEEEPLLVSENGDRKGYFTAREKFDRELKRMCWIAFPMVVVSVSQYMLRAVSMMMLGHLGELTLSSASIATSLTNVTGFSVIVSSASRVFFSFRFLVIVEKGGCDLWVVLRSNQYALMFDTV